MDSSSDRGAPGALGESDSRFDGRGGGVMQAAALRKALDLWQRIHTLEK